MALALFDLDNTLLNGDSDHAWGVYLGEIGVLDQAEQTKAQDYFYAQYTKGDLDIFEFLEYQLSVLADHEPQQLFDWRADYVETRIKPMVDQEIVARLEHHRDQGDKLVIITATNDFVTQPIADLLNVDTLIATTAEKLQHGYTGKVTGTPCFQDGKITRLNDWLAGTDFSYKDSWFYSDSHNDLPLLKKVDKPVAVKPDPVLLEFAQQNQWEIINP